MSTNKDCFKQYRNFSGSMREWFNLCVRESDVFRGMVLIGLTKPGYVMT